MAGQKAEAGKSVRWNCTGSGERWLGLGLGDGGGEGEKRMDLRRFQKSNG